MSKHNTLSWILYIMYSILCIIHYFSYFVFNVIYHIYHVLHYFVLCWKYEWNDILKYMSLYIYIYIDIYVNNIGICWDAVRVRSLAPLIPHQDDDASSFLLCGFISEALWMHSALQQKLNMDSPPVLTKRNAKPISSSLELTLCQSNSKTKSWLDCPPKNHRRTATCPEIFACHQVAQAIFFKLQPALHICWFWPQVATSRT